MTSKVKQVESIVLQYPMWLDEFYTPKNMIGENRMSAAGVAVMYEASIKTPTRTLLSRESGWLSEDNITDLKTLWSVVGNTFSIIYDDDSTDVVAFDRSRALSFTEVSEGMCEYTAVIPMMKVIA